MKSKLLLAAFCLSGMSASAQQTADSQFAEPAFRSPVVAVEFTGQRCRYCPSSTRALKASEEKYGRENYIVTALHNLERFSLLPSQHVSLFNAEAALYAASIKVHDGLPQLAYNSLGPDISDLPLYDMFKTDDLLECTGKAIANDQRKVELNVKTRLRSNMQDFIAGKKVDILFWAMENDIVALQDDNGLWTYPAHQHIFRGSINGTWGESYEIGKEYQQVWTLPQGVSVVENAEVVVFFLDHESKVILDAGRFKVEMGDVTGIDAHHVINDEKTTPIYDLSGRRVYEPVKGSIYIQNGKKFIAK